MFGHKIFSRPGARGWPPVSLPARFGRGRGLGRAGGSFWTRAVWLIVLALFNFSTFDVRLRGAEQFPEYQLKAAFLYNFAKFVTWPDKSFAQPETPLTIGLIGTDPFGALLKDTIEGKTVNGRKLALKHLNRDDNPKDCHILFISRSEKDRISSILSLLHGESILTVSEVDRFAHNGGMVNFVVVSESVRFEINVQAAESAGLRVSSKLAGVGIVVKPEPKKEGK